MTGLLITAGLLFWTPVSAQTMRPLPESAQAGRLRLGVFPAATLDDAPVTLSAGTRIYDRNNIIRLPVEITGERKVAYTRGAMGEVRDVWLLTDAEYGELARRHAELLRAPAVR